MVPFGDCPTPRPAVDYQDWGGGGFGSMQDGDGQMAVVPWVLVACHLELGGYGLPRALNRLETGSIGGRRLRATSGGQEGGESNHDSDRGAGTLHRVHRTHREISQWCRLASVRSRVGGQSAR